MGTAASEALTDNCHPRCMEACPSVAYEAELQRRQTRRSSTEVNRQAIGTGAEPIVMSPFFGAFCGGSNMVNMKTMHTMHGAVDNLLLQQTEEERQAEEATAALKARLAVRRPDDDLQHGAMRGDLKKVQRALEMRSDATKVNSRGVSPLMLAASSSGKEAIEVLKELHRRQADIQKRDNNGWTVFLHACRNGKLEVARELLNLDADPSTTTKDHKTSLMLAVMEGKIDLVRELLKLKPVRLQLGERDNLGATALHFAVKGGAVEITKVLLEAQARPNTKDIDQRTPLMWACEHGSMECARSLAKKGAELDSKDKGHRSALLYACLNGYEGVALWLLKKGTDPNAKDVSGDSALSIAQELGLAELKKFIKLQTLQEDVEEDVAGDK